MYQPSYYKKDNPEFIGEFIRTHPFAIMVSKGEKLIATHIPILIEESTTELQLFGHIANHNKQFDYLEDGAEVLLIFNGPHGYISSSWYEEADISTWNYSAVHVNAKLNIQTAQELEDSLKKLVYYFERKQENPLLYDDLPEKLIQSHLPEITGFWLNPIKIEGISKMSQNQSTSNISSILDHLKEEKDTLNLREHIKNENEKDDI